MVCLLGANGTFNFKVGDYITLIDKVAGVKNTYLVDDVKLRITSILRSITNEMDY